MIRSLRAIVWLRWRLLINSMRGGRRRDSLEQVSRALGALMPFAFFALMLGTIAAVCVLGFLGGRAIATGLVEPAIIVLIVRVSLMVLLALLVVVSLASPVQTALSRYSRLLILPIPRQSLHLTEVLANLLDPWIGFIVPGLFLFAVGLAAGGAPMAAAIAVAGGLGIMAVIASAGALISFLVGWLFRSRRRSELFTLTIVLCVSLIAFVPALISKNIDTSRRERRGAALTVEEFDSRLPVWTAALPSEQYGRAVLASIEGRYRSAVFSLGWLWLSAVLLFMASSWTHRRLIDSMEGDTRRKAGRGGGGRTWRLPLASPAVSAIAIAEYRTAVRSVRGRLAVLLPGPLIALMTMLLREMPEERTWLTAMASEGHLVLAAGLVFAIYALQPFTMNLFGVDRGGLTRLFLIPARDVDLARGKIAGCGLILATSGVIVLVTTIGVAPTGPVVFWIATILGGMATFAWLSPVAVLLSTFFPVPADLSKTGTGGNPHPLPMFAGTIIVMALALPAAGVFLLNWLWIRQNLAVLMLMIVWLAISIACAVPLVGLASRAIRLRRENLALVAQQR